MSVAALGARRSRDETHGSARLSFQSRHGVCFFGVEVRGRFAVGAGVEAFLRLLAGEGLGGDEVDVGAGGAVLVGVVDGGDGWGMGWE